MTDLVTRLRALADRYGNDFDMPFRGNTVTLLQEAADALDSLQSDRDAHRRCHHDKIIEVCDLKAELAEAEKVIHQDGWCKTEALDHWVARAEKAEAEAAALREARFYSTRDGHRARVLCEDGHLKDFPVVGYIEWGDSIVSQCWTSEGKRVIGQDDPEDLLGFSLSQPGPGAALLHKFAIAKLALERIARGGMTVVAVDALAALEEKP
jgi:hypothetical protein